MGARGRVPTARPASGVRGAGGPLSPGTCEVWSRRSGMWETCCQEPPSRRKSGARRPGAGTSGPRLPPTARGAGTARRVSQMQGRTRGPPWPPAAALRRMPWPSAASGKSDLREATAQAPEWGRVPSYRGGLLPPRPPGPTETATSASCPGRNIPCLSVPGPARGPGAT